MAVFLSARKYPTMEICLSNIEYRISNMDINMGWFLFLDVQAVCFTFTLLLPEQVSVSVHVSSHCKLTPSVYAFTGSTRLPC